MSYWACAQLESNRTRLALHCLDKVVGYEIYNPQLREQRRRHGRKIMSVTQLFPSYVFVLIVSGWWNARWSPGVIRLVMGGDERPAVGPDAVIAEIRSRERNGFVELPKARGLVPGTRVRLVSGPFCDRIGLVAGLRGHERVLCLLNLLGAQQRVEVARNMIEAIQ